MADTTQIVQTKKLRLGGAGCTSTATSIILASFYLGDDTTLAAMSNFGTIGYITIEPGTSKEENISFTGITQNGDGTATLTGVTRGLGFVAPYTEVSANKKAHAGGAIAIVSNSAPFYNGVVMKGNDEIITGIHTFTQPPVVPTPVGGTDASNKAYVDSVVAGIATTVNLVVAGVAGETLVAGNLVYLKAADGRWWLCDADTASTVENVNLGIAQGAGSAGVAITGGVLTQGLDANQSGLTASTKYYAGNTAGAISSSAGTKEVTVGFSHPTDATKLYFQPRFDQHLTEDEQDALAGTSGTPSNSNKFVTNDDTATAATASKVVRRNGDASITGVPSAVDVQTFTSSGTWTKPTVGTPLRVLVQAWGAGGGGGGCLNNEKSGGGGGGAYREVWFPIASLGATETITIGTGGAGGLAGDNNGTAGGNTTVGSLVTAYGGNGGSNGDATGSNSDGGGGGGSDYANSKMGTSVHADGFYGGGAGDSVTGPGGNSTYGGAGGGGAQQTSSNGGNSIWGGAGGGGGGTTAGGTGGTSLYGGNGGNGGTDAVGAVGSQPGGGGGGSGSNGGGNRAGGDGGAGKVIITTFF